MKLKSTSNNHNQHKKTSIQLTGVATVDRMIQMEEIDEIWLDPDARIAGLLRPDFKCDGRGTINGLEIRSPETMDFIKKGICLWKRDNSYHVRDHINNK